MLIRPALTPELVTPAVLKVTSKCGEKQQLAIWGVTIEFICGSETTPTPEPTQPQETISPQGTIPSPEVIPSPEPQPPGRVALVIDDVGTLLGQLPETSAIDPHADPIVITVPHDRSVSLNDLVNDISVAHQEHRAIRFDIGSQ
jgi:hypothetical protein